MLNRKEKKAKKREEELRQKKANKGKSVEKIQYGKDLILETQLGVYTLTNLTRKKELELDFIKRKINRNIDREAILAKYGEDQEAVSIEIMSQVLSNTPIEDVEEIGIWGIDNIPELENDGLLVSFQAVYLITLAFWLYRFQLKKK